MANKTADAKGKSTSEPVVSTVSQNLATCMEVKVWMKSYDPNNPRGHTIFTGRASTASVTIFPFEQSVHDHRISIARDNVPWLQESIVSLRDPETRVLMRKIASQMTSFKIRFLYRNSSKPAAPVNLR